MHLTRFYRRLAPHRRGLSAASSSRAKRGWCRPVAIARGGLVALPLLLLTFISTVAGEEPAFSMIADGILLHRGHHVDLEDPDRGDIANASVIIGERCVALIDPGGSVAVARRLQASLTAFTDKPVCAVINTHVHFDHVLGDSVFVGPDAPLYGHKDLGPLLAASREFFTESFAAELDDGGELAPEVLPSELVSDTRQIDLGNRVLTLRAHRRAHSSADLSVFDEKTSTLFTGDLVFRERIPVVDGSLLGWFAVLDELAALPATLVVPGHGAPASSFAEAAADERRYLTVLRDETREAVAAGLFIEEAKDSIGASERGKWLLFDQNHRRNVSRAFRELEWE